MKECFYYSQPYFTFNQSEKRMYNFTIQTLHQFINYKQFALQIH